MNINKVLVISAHTDDAELAAGGIISRLIEQGKEVTYLAFSYVQDERLINECRAATTALGITDVKIYNFANRVFSYHRQEILDKLLVVKNEMNPDFVITHGDKDQHQDHQVVHMESMRAFKDRSMIGYCHGWNTRKMDLDFFIKLDRQHLDRKIKALKCYESQSHRHYMNPEYIEASAIATGAMIGEQYAEAFQVLNAVF